MRKLVWFKLLTAPLARGSAVTPEMTNIATLMFLRADFRRRNGSERERHTKKNITET